MPESVFDIGELELPQAQAARDDVGTVDMTPCHGCATSCR